MYHLCNYTAPASLEEEMTGWCVSRVFPNVPDRARRESVPCSSPFAGTGLRVYILGTKEDALY